MLTRIIDPVAWAEMLAKLRRSCSLRIGGWTPLASCVIVRGKKVDVACRCTCQVKNSERRDVERTNRRRGSYRATARAVNPLERAMSAARISAMSRSASDLGRPWQAPKDSLVTPNPHLPKRSAHIELN